MKSFNLSAALLAAAGIFRSTEETRYYLGGVFVEPDPNPETGRGVRMVATDGHRLCIFHDPQGMASDSAILSFDFKSKALKARKRDRHPRRLIFDMARRETAAAGVHLSGGPDDPGILADTLHVSEIDGTFPDYRWVVPMKTFEQATPCLASFNTRFLQDCLDAHGRAYGTPSAGVTIRQAAAGEPAIITPSSMMPDQAAVFVVMPIRETRPIRPFWLDFEAARKTEAAA